MKTKGIIITICSILIISFVLGATGTITLRSAKAAENRDEYTLIGVFVTKDDLFGANFTIDPFNLQESFDATLPSKQSFSQKGNRIYATVSKYPDGYNMIRFEGIEGSAFLDSLYKTATACVFHQIDPGFCSISSLISSYNYSNRTVKLNANLYLPISDKTEHHFRLYPVYLDKEENAFIDRVDFNSLLSVREGFGDASQTITYTQTYSTTINGKTEHTESIVEVKVLFEREADTVTILEYNAKNELIGSKTYATADVPECCKLLQDTEYVIVETRRGEELKREFIEYKDDSSIKSFYVFKNTETGLIDASSHSFEK